MFRVSALVKAWQTTALYVGLSAVDFGWVLLVGKNNDHESSSPMTPGNAMKML